MDQSLFSKVVKERIMDFMPPIYDDYTPKIEIVNKVNESKEALMLAPEDKGLCNALPMVYMDDMYEVFCENEDLEETLRIIANVFMNNIGRSFPGPEAFHFEEMKDRVVMELINTERNQQLLETIPHLKVINMSVIYRIMMQSSEGGFDSILVNESIMEDMGLDRRELHRLALDNTKKLMQPMILDLSAKAFMVSNQYQMFGSAAILFEDVMVEVSERLGEKRFYVVPCSIHEFIAVPKEGTDLESLIDMLAEGNQMFTREKDVLSNAIYEYDTETKEIKKAASYRWAAFA